MSGSVSVVYSPNYFSLADILATQERVPCTSSMDLTNVGFLDPGSDHPNLAPGTKLELPYWMVDGMRTTKNYLNLQVPRFYKESYREILLANPNVVDLHKLGPYYYEFGRYLMKHSQEEGEMVGASVSKAFKSRFLNILDAAQNCRDGEALKEMSKMDELEREMFRKAYKKRKDMNVWIRREMHQINTSTAVINHRKRKAMTVTR